MSANKFLPHVHVLPEDDANRQVANGFWLGDSLIYNRFQVLEEAGGWNEVMERFCSIYVAQMERVPTRFMILLIDLDNRLDRLDSAKARIPVHLQDRVFILGALTEPEDLKLELGSYESIGLAMARDCVEGTNFTWNHRLLRHNGTEIDRLRTHVQPFLFVRP